MIKIKKNLLSLLVLFTFNAWSGQVAVVIDDFGYQQRNERALINLSPTITVSILPNAVHTQRMAMYAHQHGNDILIHLPMAPVSSQPLEKDTLFPAMHQKEINRIIDEAVMRVPFAIGVNNHMGSLMTANRNAMGRVMIRLARYNLFYLDSRTTADSQAAPAAAQYGVPFLTRQVFLDDMCTERAITVEWQRALRLARKTGQAIVIGHPYDATLAVLSRQMSQLPSDITLVRLRELVPVVYGKITLGDILNNLRRESKMLFYKWRGNSVSFFSSPASESMHSAL